MATEPKDNGKQTFTKEQRAIIVRGLDAIMASNSRSNAREHNQIIREAREKENQQIVIIKNGIMTGVLNLE